MDKTVSCRDCGQDFLFTEGEQAFYKEKGFTNEPTRCKDCRQKRKSQNNDRPRSRQMYDVTCSECGCSTQVPFQPTGDRPVYCKDCFESKKSY